MNSNDGGAPAQGSSSDENVSNRGDELGFGAKEPCEYCCGYRKSASSTSGCERTDNMLEDGEGETDGSRDGEGEGVGRDRERAVW